VGRTEEKDRRTVWDGHPHPQRLSTSRTPIEASQSFCDRRVIMAGM